MFVHGVSCWALSATILAMQVVYVHGERFRGAVPLIPMLRPWHGVWFAQKVSGDVFE